MIEKAQQTQRGHRLEKERVVSIWVAYLAKQMASSFPQTPVEVVLKLAADSAIDLLACLVGLSGWIACVGARRIATIEQADVSHSLIGIVDGGQRLDVYQCYGLLTLAHRSGHTKVLTGDISAELRNCIDNGNGELLDALDRAAGWWLEREMDKLDDCENAQRKAHASQVDELHQEIKSTKRTVRLVYNESDALALHQKLCVLENRLAEVWQDYHAASGHIRQQKNALLVEVSRRAQQPVEFEMLYAIRWTLV